MVQDKRWGWGELRCNWGRATSVFWGSPSYSSSFRTIPTSCPVFWANKCLSVSSLPPSLPFSGLMWFELAFYHLQCSVLREIIVILLAPRIFLAQRTAFSVSILNSKKQMCNKKAIKIRLPSLLWVGLVMSGKRNKNCDFFFGGGEGRYLSFRYFSCCDFF